MESKTIRVRLSKHNIRRADQPGWRTLSLTFTDEQLKDIEGRDIELTITPVASPEERLHGKRWVKVGEYLDTCKDEGRDPVSTEVVRIIERVDAEFAKGEAQKLAELLE